MIDRKTNTINFIDKNFSTSKQELENNYRALLFLYEENKNQPIGNFIEEFLEWKEDKNSDYSRNALLYSMFKKVIKFDEQNFISSFVFFISNCFLDDYGFQIKWIIPKYEKIEPFVFSNGKTIERFRSVYDKSGNQIMEETTFENKDSEPEVIFNSDGSQDPNILLEAMKINLERNILLQKELQNFKNIFRDSEV